MQKMRTFLLALIILSASASAQLNIQWAQHYGGNLQDCGHYVQPTTDGGFIITGVIQLDQYGDIYLVKTDSLGDTLWTRTYGGAEHDRGYCVQQTTDGGYIISGITNEPNYGLSGDLYVLKTDMLGDTIWTRIFDFGVIDCGYSVLQLDDGDYIIAGLYDGGFPQMFGDVLLMKLDADGDPIWTRNYHGHARDCGYSLIQTSDGGFIIAGATNEDLYGGYSEVYLIKTDANGNLVWDRNLGYGKGLCVRQTTDEGYIIAGWTNIVGSSEEVYAIKTDVSGDTVWTRTWGGYGADFGFSVVQTDDGGYIIAGMNFEAALASAYFVKCNADGNTIWEDTYSGGYYDEAKCIQTTTNGGYIVTGLTFPPAGMGSIDVLLLRFDEDSGQVNLTLTPHNPPIQIPTGGGSFDFDLAITNNTSTSYTIDVAANVTLPSGIIYPIFLRQGIDFPAGEVITRDDLTQFVPATTSAGDYSYNAYVYDHDTWQILAEDSFPFEKLPGDGAPAHNFGWTLYGWDGEEAPVITHPSSFILHPVHPNPFNASTVISYQLQADSYVELKVYDVMGREVARLVEGYRSAGAYKVVFDGGELRSGVYFTRLTTEGFHQTQKLLLIK